MTVPLWVTLLCAAIFGCVAYLAPSLAAALYGRVPVAPGRAPAALLAVVPAACATVLGGAMAARGSGLATLAEGAVVVFGLSATVWTDSTRRLISDWFTLPPLALVLAIDASEGIIVSTAISVVLVTLPFALAALLSKGKGLGWGDVKLVALGAALLDVQTSLLVLGAGCFVASAVALARRRHGEPFAFAPYLAAAVVAGLILPAAPVLGI